MNRAVRAIAAIVLSGCYHPNPATGVPCAANGDCPDGQTCDMQQSPPVCVATPGSGSVMDAPLFLDAPPDAPPACTDSSTCATADPICDPATHTCRGCIADAECTGGVCVEYSGQCVADADVLFVSPTGSDLFTCTRAMPCATLNYAFTLLTSTVHVIRIGNGAYAQGLHLQSGSYGLAQVVLSGETSDPAGATFVAPSSPAFLFDLSTNALLEGVTVMGGTGDGIDSRSQLIVSRVAATGNSGAGINENGGTLLVADSTITYSNNLGITSGKGVIDLERDVVLGNQGGGVRTQQGPVTIVNCIVASNGTGGSTGTTVGGLRLDNLVTLGSRIEFDTIAYNQITTGTSVSAGVQISATFDITNMILADNGASGSPQMAASVAVTHSLFEGGPAPQGMGNKSGSPAFKDITNGDFHITAGSLAIDNAGASTVLVDIDGDARPYGPASDMGADEYHP